MERRSTMKSNMNQTSNGRRVGAISFWIASAAIATLVAAQPMHADDAQPAARAVHLSYVEGQVRVTQGDQVIAEGATVNMPLFEGMQITTVQDGRAEIQFEDGSVARLSPNTTVTLSVLHGDGTSGDAEMVLNGGLAYFEFKGGTQLGQFAVHFGDSTVTASGNAVIRIRMDTPPGDLAILSGNADLNRGKGAMQLAMHGGESVSLYANDINRYDLNESIDPDSWDDWNTDRDEALATEESTFTAPPPSQSGPESGSPAWSDLDANGSWYDVPGQGYMWSPFEASNPGWDPYGCGNWMFYPRFGYMFVPCDSWGFLPYSFGSWNYFGDFGWGWVPGGGGPWWYSYPYYPGPTFGPLPPGYRPPHRPIVPRGSGPSPGRPWPVIAVNHHPVSGGTPFPNRGHNTPVTIAGNTVAPLRPVVVRGGGNSAMGGAARPSFTIFDGSARSDSSTGRPVYNSPNPARASSAYPGSPGAYASGASRGSTPAHPGSPAPARSSSGGASHASSGGGSYHASSGGGGGGGGSHGGGGGGGGGGGAHK
jgi:hypothetical protein